MGYTTTEKQRWVGNMTNARRRGYEVGSLETAGSDGEKFYAQRASLYSSEFQDDVHERYTSAFDPNAPLSQGATVGNEEDEDTDHDEAGQPKSRFARARSLDGL